MSNAAGGQLAPADVEQAADFIRTASEATIRQSVEATRRGHTAAWREGRRHAS